MINLNFKPPIMKKNVLLLIILMSFTYLNVRAQDTEVQENSQNFNLSVDLVSNYIWRGLTLSDAPNMQPYLDFTGNNGNFSVGAIGSYSFGDFYSEVDLFAGYSIGMLRIELWDYFIMSQQYENRFFDFKNETTGHALEGVLIFTGPESFPIQFTAGTFFYGADKKPNGDNYYSTYFELAYPFSWKSNNLTVFAGVTPAEGLYGSEFAMNNFGITNEREIKINDNFSIPIKGSIIVNPHLENIFFVLSITLAAND